MNKGGYLTVNRWILTCSIDAVGIDYEQIIESEQEPGFWDCEEIAQEHGCEWWSLDRLDD